ncbi:Txe/YoeB family addiction module toxin [Pedobacter sp.]
MKVRKTEKHYRLGAKASIQKIEKILTELEATPYSGYGQPAQLKYELSNYWSSSINKKDRMIYAVEENIVTVTIMSAIGHYEGK